MTDEAISPLRRRMIEGKLTAPSSAVTLVFRL